jgi:hypothetical protein
LPSDLPTDCPDWHGFGGIGWITRWTKPQVSACVNMNYQSFSMTSNDKVVGSNPIGGAKKRWSKGYSQPICQELEAVANGIDSRDRHSRQGSARGRTLPT